MNDKLLDTLFTRRRDAVTRLAFCLLISALLAVAGRIPNLFASLPAAWVSGGLSSGCLPPVLWLFLLVSMHADHHARIAAGHFYISYIPLFVFLKNPIAGFR